jgi:hypothetical protein
MPTAFRAFAWICWLSAVMSFGAALYEWGNLPGGLNAAARNLAFQQIGTIIGTSVTLVILGTLLRAAAEALELLRRGVRAVELKRGSL